MKTSWDDDLRPMVCVRYCFKLDSPCHGIYDDTSCPEKHRPKWHREDFKELRFLTKDQFSFALNYNYVWDEFTMNGSKGVRHHPFSGLKNIEGFQIHYFKSKGFT